MSIRITGMNSGLDTDAMVQELVNAYDKKKQTYKGSQKKLQWKQDAWKELNTKVKNFVSKSLSNMRFSSNYKKKVTTCSNTAAASVVTSDGAVNGRQTLKVTALAQSGYLTGGKITATGSTKLSELGYNEEDSSITITKGDGTSQTISVDKDLTVDEFLSTLRNVGGVNANFDETNGRIYVSATETGSANNFSFGGDEDALKALGLFGTDGKNGNAKKIEGTDAAIVLNGVEYESSSNSFSINGLTITAKAETGDEELTLSTETDYNSIYDNIKSFLKEYNSLINQMDSLYNAVSADDYDMLTDEQKEEMSDEEVKEWEDKIKSALLRRDENLSSLSSALRNSMLSTYEIDGKTYSLASFGISTLSYFLAGENEKNAYHINGDPDDSNTMGEPDKLKAAIASDPNAVMTFFTSLANDMNAKMNKLSSSSQYRSYGSFYDDKKLQKEYDNWSTKIKDYEDYVAKIEDRYYKQFTAMEKAMGEMQSQQTYIQQLMG